MQFTQLPSRVRDLSLDLVDIEGAIAKLKQDLLEIEMGVETQIAFNLELRNDRQRDAKRFEILKANDLYEKSQDVLRQFQQDRAIALAELEFARSQLSILKLVTKQAIADQLSGLDIADLAA